MLKTTIDTIVSKAKEINNAVRNINVPGALKKSLNTAISALIFSSPFVASPGFNAHAEEQSVTTNNALTAPGGILEEKVIGSINYSKEKDILLIDSKYVILPKFISTDTGEAAMVRFADSRIGGKTLKDTQEPLIAAFGEKKCDVFNSDYESFKRNVTRLLERDTENDWSSSKAQLYYDLLAGESLIKAYKIEDKHAVELTEHSIDDVLVNIKEYEAEFKKNISDSAEDLERAKDVEIFTLVPKLEYLASSVSQYKNGEENATHEAEVKGNFKRNADEYVGQAHNAIKYIRERIAASKAGNYPQEDLLVDLQFLQDIAKWMDLMVQQAPQKGLMSPDGSVYPVINEVSQLVQIALKEGLETAIYPDYKNLTTGQKMGFLPSIQYFASLSAFIGEKPINLHADIQLASIKEDIARANEVAQNFLANEYVVANSSDVYQTALAAATDKIQSFDLAELQEKEGKAKLASNLRSLKVKIAEAGGVTQEYLKEYNVLRDIYETLDKNNPNDVAIMAAVEAVNREGLTESAKAVGVARLTKGLAKRDGTRYIDENGNVRHADKGEEVPMWEWPLEVTAHNPNYWPIVYDVTVTAQGNSESMQITLGVIKPGETKFDNTNVYQMVAKDVRITNPPAPMLTAYGQHHQNRNYQNDPAVRFSNRPDIVATVASAPRQPEKIASVPGFMPEVIESMKEKYGVQLRYGADALTVAGDPAPGKSSVMEEHPEASAR